MRTLAIAILLAFATVAAGCVQTPSTTSVASNAAPKIDAVAGLEGVVHGPNGTLLAAPAGLVRALGGMYKIGASSAEPTIGVDMKSGTLYMTGNDKSALPLL